MNKRSLLNRLVVAAVAMLIVGVACDAGASAPTATSEPATAESATLPPAPTEAGETPAAACEPPLPNASIVRDEKWDIYCDDGHGFGFRYPSGGIGTAPGDVNLFLPVIAGTNLAEKYISVVVQEGAVTCESPNTASMTASESVNINGVDWYKQTGSDAGAGSFWDWEAYSHLEGELCVSLTFVMHSNSLGVFETPPAEFNKDVESVPFSLVMDSFIFFSPGGLKSEGQGQEPIPTAEGSVVSSTDCNPPAPTGKDAELLFGTFCNTVYKFGFHYGPVGDSGYTGEGPVSVPFTPEGSLIGKYLEVAAAQDQIGCYSAWGADQPFDSIPTENLVINDLAFTRQTGSTVDSNGNTDFWDAYSTSGNNLCVILTFVIESSSAQPTFDVAAESEIFKTIMTSFFWYES